VRHALIRLHGERLIIGTGTAVRPGAGPERYRSLYEARRALEIGALWLPRRPAQARPGALAHLREAGETLRRDSRRPTGF